MAQSENMNKVSSSTPNKRSTTEIREWYEKNKDKISNFESAENALKQLRNVTKTSTRNITSFKKDTIRSYLQSPATNERNLRNLSRYLFYRSHIYFRLVKFYANMFCLDVCSVIPNFDLTKGGDQKKVLKSFNDTQDVLDKMGLQREMLKANVIALREDAAYYCVFYDEDNGMFLMNLDPDYCKIDGQYFTGDFSFAMDMSYWRSREEIVEYLGDPIQSMYRAFQSSGEKWQHFEDQYAFCIKFRNEDYDLIIPPFAAMFEDLISLLDLQEIQAISDEQQIYKLLYIPMDTIGENIDDWKIDPDTIIKYYNRMINDEGFPDYASATIIPGKELKVISFEDDATTDSNKLQKAMSNLLDISGGGELLLGSNIQGTTAFKAAQISNTEFAISSLLPQIESFVNRFLSYYVSNPCKVKFAPISVYTKEDYKKELLDSAQYGLPTKLLVNACNGFSAKDTMSLNFLEEQCLGVTELFVPLQSSHTQSGSDTGGRPKNDTPTDESEASEEKRDNVNG